MTIGHSSEIIIDILMLKNVIMMINKSLDKLSCSLLFIQLNNVIIQSSYRQYINSLTYMLWMDIRLLSLIKPTSRNIEHL